jgi:hypothetical protein
MEVKELSLESVKAGSRGLKIVFWMWKGGSMEVGMMSHVSGKSVSRKGNRVNSYIIEVEKLSISAKAVSRTCNLSNGS